MVMDVGGIGVAAVWINDDGPMTELDIAFEVAQRLLNWTPALLTMRSSKMSRSSMSMGSLAWKSGGHR